MDGNGAYGGASSGGGGMGYNDYNDNNNQGSYNDDPNMMIQPPNSQQQQGGGMTIEEMRHFHHSALTSAESKRTELRLVLASRYRELVGSSDEVIHMNERAEELNDLVLILPELCEGVTLAANNVDSISRLGNVNNVNVEGSSRKLFSDGAAAADDKSSSSQVQDDKQSETATSSAIIRDELSRLPRDIHRCLDEHNVHGAAASLISLFDIIAASQQQSIVGDKSEDPFPLAIALSSCKKKGGERKEGSDTQNMALLETQMKMIYLHVQTLPTRTVKLARKVLLKSGGGDSGAHVTAAALSALDLLDIRRWQEQQQQQRQISVPRIIGSSDTLSSRATKLIDLYYESKATLLNKLLNKLTLPDAGHGVSSSLPPSAASILDATSVTNRAEIILSKIVLILQYDVILYPYQIFVLRKFITSSSDGNGSCDKIMSTLPTFDPDVLKSKASRFLAAHLPLIRTKVKSVLMIIAGTTASKLGQIRQTLYDKTDGAECRTALDSSGVCTWDEAVGGMVDVRVVSHGTSASFATTSKDSAMEDHGGGTAAGSSSMNGSSSKASSAARRFSLWGALFSNTFSSLVHSLLTSSFHSVHVRVVSTLRTSLARAPPFTAMLPHEAHRNALRIASDLDASLRRVSDDAHELLVHAEEREESERRLRQSLYVQTCEIMGRLLNELRRMLVVIGSDDYGKGRRMDEGNEKKEQEDATKVLIIGRLCHLLKFRLKSLPTLLDPKSSPAVILAAGLGVGGGKSHSGMITLMELSSSFDLADDDDDGLISFDEAMEAMESAFSGTHFHGAEMVRDTLLLAHSSAPGAAGVVGDGISSSGVPNGGTYASTSNKSTPQNVTLSELALLSARGLRHAASGHESALGTVQSSLDDIVDRCFKDWARAALSPPLKSFATTLRESMGVASTVSDMEWRRLHGLIDKEDDVLLKEISESDGGLTQGTTSIVGEVSPHVVSYLLAVAGVLNRSVCPADSLPPVPSLEYAEALGISSTSDTETNETEIPNMMVTIRGSLLGEALASISQSLQQGILHTSDDDAAPDDDDGILKKYAPSSLIQLGMDVKFIHKCFFERNQHGFLLTSDVINDSRDIMVSLITSISNDALRDGSPINIAISERHSQVFKSCDLFLSSLFGEDTDDKFSSSTSATTNGGISSALSSSQSFMLNPLPSSRRFILLPIQAEKSLTELQLRGKYGKKQEDKTSSKDGTSSGNAMGSGFGFLSSMLSTKNR